MEDILVTEIPPETTVKARMRAGECIVRVLGPNGIAEAIHERFEVATMTALERYRCQHGLH